MQNIKSTHSTPRSKSSGMLRVDTERRFLPRFKNRGLAPSNVSISFAILTLCLSLGLLSTPNVLAAPSTTASSNATDATDLTVKKKAADEALATYKAAKQADKLAKLQTLGAKLIDHRIASLNNITSNLTKHKLTSENSAVVKALIQTNIDGLDALKVKIAADTTVETAKADVKSIYDKYHVYAVLLPKIHLTIAQYQVDASIAKLSDIQTRMQKTIDAKNSTADAATLTSALTDLKNQLADASADSALAKQEIAKMIQTDTAVSKTAATAARGYITSARASLVAIRGDL